MQRIVIFSLMILSLMSPALGQTQNRSDLEKQREDIQREIQEVKRSLDQTKKNRKESLGQLALLQRKLRCARPL